MTFDVAADAYDRFMGRYSVPLAPLFAAFADVAPGGRVLDVGCGPGALTGVLLDRRGGGGVSAVDPSDAFVAAARDRHPGLDVRRATAEALPFDDAEFEAALAQLVVHFMADPLLGLREMLRVTRQHGAVAACVWDHSGGRGPLSSFWRSARALDPAVDGESRLAGSRRGHLAALLRRAGAEAVAEAPLAVEVEHADFEEWWRPFTLGVGPAGAHVAGLDGPERARLRDACRERMGEGPITVTAVAWAARGAAPG